MAPTSTRSPMLYPETPAPNSSITPTGSCPIINPGITGYSPLTMCRSVPQIVVIVTRITASPARARGFSTSSIPILFLPRKTFALISTLPYFSLRMRSFPMSLLNTFGPTPKTSLLHSCWFIRPKIFVEIKTVASNSLNHKFHFVLITCDRFLSLDLCRDVRRRNLCLTHSHMAHLWPIEVHAVADRIQSFVADNAHRPVDI